MGIMYYTGAHSLFPGNTFQIIEFVQNLRSDILWNKIHTILNNYFKHEMLQKRVFHLIHSSYLDIISKVMLETWYYHHV